MIVVSDTSPLINLAAVGQLDLLRQLYQHGIIVAVKPILDDLIAKAGFWIGGDLYQRVLQAVSE